MKTVIHLHIFYSLNGKSAVENWDTVKSCTFGGSWNHLQCNLFLCGKQVQQKYIANWDKVKSCTFGSWKYMQVMMIQGSLEFLSGPDLISKQIFQWNYGWKLGHSKKLYFEIFAVRPTIFHREKTRSWWQ